MRVVDEVSDGANLEIMLRANFSSWGRRAMLLPFIQYFHQVDGGSQGSQQRWSTLASV
jgi:hypothetical protein